jgi:hypothetical protein
VYGPQARSRKPYVKDAFHRFVVDGDASAVNPEPRGTKACARFRAIVPPGGSVQFRLRLTEQAISDPLAAVDAALAQRQAEADEFYDAITPPAVTDDAKAVMRQALAGMLWSKQCYYFDVDRWLRERHVHPLRAPTRRGSRNESWFHMVNHDVVSMPDKMGVPVVCRLGPGVPLHSAGHGRS